MTTLLEVSNLKTCFDTRNGTITAVDNVSFSVDHGETLAIVGESGSGKSVSCYSMLGLIPSPPGRIAGGQALFEGTDLLTCGESILRDLRGNKIAMIFQDPMTSLNPFLTVGEQLVEPLMYHRDLNRQQAKQRAVELMQEVGIRDAEHTFSAWPHEFSGGMRQRIMIAMALITEPKLLIADEPTTALDVTIQKQILELMKEIQQRRNIGVIFISHDLAVVKELADKVIVMKKGQVVEQGKTQSVFESPHHEYTKKLIAAIPREAKPVVHDQDADTILKVSNLVTTFNLRHTKEKFTAVNNVSFELRKKEILGLVGESGSGKSTLGRSVLRLVEPESGHVMFEEQNTLAIPLKQFKPVRKRMQMIFQDPYASLNPRMTVFETLAEPLLLHNIADRKNVSEKVLSLMDDVGLAHSHIRKYPHEFSGGQRQRIAIGRAIASRPDIVIADEPVSALDVTIQKQILELLLHLTEKWELSMLFISHDLAVVRYLCDRIMVMKQGQIVESGQTEEIWTNPRENYTQQLLQAIPTAV